jgi:hypothetical protein
MLLRGSRALSTRAPKALAQMESISLTNFVVIAVAVPLVVSVVGGLLTSRIDRWLATVNAHYRLKSEQRETAHLALFAELEERRLLPVFLMRLAFDVTISCMSLLGLYIGLMLSLVAFLVLMSHALPPSYSVFSSPHALSGGSIGVGIGVLLGGLMWWFVIRALTMRMKQLRRGFRFAMRASKYYGVWEG